MLVLTVLAVPLVALLRPAARAKIDPAAAVE
jgi:hypothetical protein